MNKFTLTIFMAIADRELIGIRTKVALDAARARGVKLGNGGEYLSDDDRQRGADANRQQAQQAYLSTADHARMMRSEGSNTGRLRPG